MKKQQDLLDRIISDVVALLNAVPACEAEAWLAHTQPVHRITLEEVQINLHMATQTVKDNFEEGVEWGPNTPKAPEEWTPFADHVYEGANEFSELARFWMSAKEHN